MLSRSVLRYSAIPALLGLALLAPICLGVTREFTRTYPLQGDGTFELNNVNGTVRIEAWDKNEVEVHAIKTTPNREALLDLVAIDVDSKPDSLSISTRYPEEEGVEVAVDYLIRVPRHALLIHINNINGTLRVVNSDHLGDLRTVNGNVEVYEGGGNVHAHTTNGNVFLELKTPGDMQGTSAETTNGSVVLAVPADVSADLEARCLNGNFSSELPLELRSADQLRIVHGKLGHGGTPIHLGTVNGAIRVVALRSTV